MIADKRPADERIVLVVDDDEMNIKLFKGILERDDYRALDARDADSCIQMAREHRPDLILMDVQLGDEDGFAVTRRLKSDPDLKDIPIIAVSGYAFEDFESRLADAGCSGFIGKPVSIKDFRATVRNFLRPLSN